MLHRPSTLATLRRLLAQRIAQRPLATRISGLLALSGGLTALLAMLVVVIVGWRSADQFVGREYTEVARVAAFALQAPLVFQDPRGVEDSIGVVMRRPEVVSVSVYDAKGKLLQHGGAGPSRPLTPPVPGGGLWSGELVTTFPIVTFGDGRVIGQVVLRADLRANRASLFAQGAAVLAAAVVALALSLVLAQRLARRIAQPIVELAEAADAVAVDHHFGVRLPPGGADEVGRAARAFNAMLDELAARGQALAEVNRSLEQRVADRTAALEAEKARAEAASQAKTRFLANMSHELRTPLNGVIGAAQLLRDQGHDEQRRLELTSIVRTSGVNLLGLIDQVLDLARVESGVLAIATEDMNLADAVEAAVATAAVGARQKGLRMVCHIEPTLAVWRRADTQRVRQVLLNLLGNATKFTQRGDIVLHVRPGAAPDEVCFDIADTGIGMRAQTMATMFEPFRQAEDGTTRRFGGSGLGLAICREVVQRMGGHIDVRSTVGEGSTFAVTLPLPPLAAPRPPPPPLGHRIAFVEPHEPSARALAALLTRMGCTATRCSDAAGLRAALAAAEAAGMLPWVLVAADDVASLDLLESVADAVEPSLLIAMSQTDWRPADAAHDTLPLSRSVLKPVLRAALSSRLGSGGDARLATDFGTPPEFAALAARVLLVEDDAVNQTIVASMLSQAGFSVEVVDNGVSALRLFAAQHFDLVITDWQMPDMDGLEVTRRLRSGAHGEHGRTVPVVALTANAFAEDRAACLAAGMNDFLTKPVMSNVLVRVANRWTGGTAPVGAAAVAD